MPIWTPDSDAAPPNHFGAFTPLDVVFDFGGPRTFTFTASDASLLLAHQCDEADGESGFLVVPITPDRVRRLKAGQTGIYAALDQERVWYVIVNESGEPRAAYQVGFDTIPADCLPDPTATLKRAAKPG